MGRIPMVYRKHPKVYEVSQIRQSIPHIYHFWYTSGLTFFLSFAVAFIELDILDTFPFDRSTPTPAQALAALNRQRLRNFRRHRATLKGRSHCIKAEKIYSETRHLDRRPLRAVQLWCRGWLQRRVEPSGAPSPPRPGVWESQLSTPAGYRSSWPVRHHADFGGPWPERC
ncbi:hypothetical protein FB451DRAFT_332673 [Mycena latifolia]|nr:hypothetical protein FB451DRAFT_332673 [Mycena latifolia]